MTFRGRGRSQHEVSTHFRHFMDEHAKGVSWFAAFERNPGRPGYHAHAVLHGLRCRRDALWKKWFQAHGRNKIEPINGKGDVVSYCAKYVTKNGKDGVWWDYRLYDRSSGTRVEKPWEDRAGNLVDQG